MKFSLNRGRRGLFQAAILILGLAALVTFVPRQFRTEATADKSDQPGGDNVTRSHKPELEYYDIRMDKTAAPVLESFRQSQNRTEADTLGARQMVLEAETELARRVPTLKVEYSPDLGAPEVIGTEVVSGTFLSGPTVPAGQKHAGVLREFLNQNNALIGLADEQVGQLKVVADYTNPDGNMSFVHFEQEINGIPVFRGEVKAGFTRDGRIIRVVNNLAPGLGDYNSLRVNAGRAEDAVVAAARAINRNAGTGDLVTESSAKNGKVITFERGQFALPTTAEQMYFPVEQGVARLAWRVLLWEDVAAYYVIVDAETGQMLWRKNITEDQTQSATYNVYNDDSPTPFAPGPNAPSGFPAAPLINRTNVTLIGNEAPNTFNNLGWLTDGNNTTDGNNVEAGIDRVAPNGVDAPVTGAARVFNFTYNPHPGNPAPGESPLLVPYQNGSATNLFYWSNRYHDSMYLLGFNEAARNFQHVNFTGMGVGNDRVSAEAQDSAGTNNANFATAADGNRGRMQMYLWNTASPQRDGDLDADIVYHELTHGTSNRLHFNASGLGANMSRGMGEGWSDFYAHCLLSTPSDPLNAIYTLAAYSTNSYYYGIRRFPKAIMSYTGGPSNRPHNPLTFADIDSTQINLSDGAYPAAFTGTSDQTHNAGEVWSSALWEVRALLITRLGPAAGNTRAMQIVTDGMKLAPANPSFLQERDAIVAAAAAISPLDVEDVLQGFAIRGMGFSARVLNMGSGANDTRVVEAFDMPNLIQGPSFAFTDAPGNGNGYAEPGENLLLTVPVQNIRGIAVTGVTVSINGGTPISYGTIGASSTNTMGVNYTVPAGTPCGSVLTLTFTINSSLGTTTATRTIQIGVPTFGGATENFDGVTAPALPNLWATTNNGSQTPWVTTTTTPDTAPNAAFGNDGASAGDSTLVSPYVSVTSAAATVTFTKNYAFETPDWDGMVLEISVNGGPYQDITAAGGSFSAGGYTGTIRVATANPLSGRQGWIGSTAGSYTTTTATLPASTNGQTVRLRWRIGADDAVGGTGARIDTVALAGAIFQNGYTCPPVVNGGNSVRADFDGDGRTDHSVFRSGTWHLLRSTAGYTGVGFGLASDEIVPGDYDGDNKTDVAVYRTGAWYILKSSDSSLLSVAWGASGDLAMTGDYDGDGKADPTVYRPSTNTFFVRRSSDGAIAAQVWGTSGDVPVAGDFDGDGKSDYAVFRSGAWHILGSTAGYSATAFGIGGDQLVPADYDGDGKDDIAVFRSGTWYMLRSTAGFTSQSWGVASDTPAPGNYDGDNKADVAVFRGSTGQWFVFQSASSTASTVSFGASGDIAVPSGYLP